MGDDAERILHERAAPSAVAPSGEAAPGGGGRVVPVILAAGASRRLGYPKALVRLGGRTLLRRAAVSALRVATGPVLVVVSSAGAESLRAELRGLPVSIVLNAGAAGGVSTSVAAAVAATPVNAAGWLFMLVDQPLVPADHLAALVAAARAPGVKAVASGYDGTEGAPMVLGAALRDGLLALRGDRGAGGLVRALPAGERRVLPCPEASLDIDTEADIARARGALVAAFGARRP